jgi:hypothetical protein
MAEPGLPALTPEREGERHEPHCCRQLAGFALAFTGCSDRSETTAQPSAERGKYLVTQGLCTDCHTPGFFLGMPDMALPRRIGRGLRGARVGRFSRSQFDAGQGNGNRRLDRGADCNGTANRHAARRQGTCSDHAGRAFASLTPSEAMSIAIYLKSLPAVSHRVPGPFGPNETPTTFVMKVVPPAGAP